MMLKRKVAKGIILAAGDGDRLGSLTLTRPKVLLPVHDQTPLIAYPIKALAAAGIGDIAVVVGYLGDMVADELDNGGSFGVRLEYITNSDYLGGNAFSVYCARNWAQREPVVLCMGDHLIEAEIVRRLLDRQNLTETLCVDYAPAPYHQLNEATKVAIDNVGCIRNIGKDIERWDALDTGVFLLTEDFFQALCELVQQHGPDVEMSDAIRYMISQGNRFGTCDASSCFWMDIDTEDELNLARA
ncbi:Bifunctional IPC transferase and DIPP synthase [subsurface metagenome]